MISPTTLSDGEDESFDRRNPKRGCCSNKNPDIMETEKDNSDRESESAADNSSDEDFTLNKPRKKRKKILKEKIPSTKKKNKIPSFEDVMNAQIQHAYSRFADYDFESDEASSINADQESANEDFLKQKEPERTPTPEPSKRKRVVIYPWRPIGITGGRPPISDMNNLD